MAFDYVGSVILEIDGTDYEATQIKVDINTGWKRVVTMNNTGRAKGKARMVKTIDIALTVAVPLQGEPNWANVFDSKITIQPFVAGGKRVTYTGFCVTSRGDSYSVDNELLRDLQGFAIDEVME